MLFYIYIGLLHVGVESEDNEAGVGLGGDDDEEDFDSDDEFAEGNVLLSYDGGANAASPLAPPPMSRVQPRRGLLRVPC